MLVVERENAKKNLVDKSSASRATDDTMNMNEKKILRLSCELMLEDFSN